MPTPILINGILASGISGHLVPPTYFVATRSDTNASATSYDGITWTNRTTPFINYPLAYNGTNFVIIGAGGTTNAAYSSDGITWTTATISGGSNWTQLAYGAGKWVTIGQNSNSPFAYSSDNGHTWTTSAAGTSDAFSGVAYGNGYFVQPATTANAGNATLYSSNGTSWSNGGTLPYAVGWGRIYYNASGGGFIVVANTSSNYVAQSSSGTGSWTARTLPGSSQGWGGCIAYGAGVWSYFSASSTQAATSPDGITWTSRTSPSAITWQNMRYNATSGIFVAVGGSGTTAATSTDGITWTLRTMSASGSWYNVTSNG
jgi:hypothetical protein